ncbi:hypothetical protein [Photobacterium lutimaris]|uniref:Uncharacterized protein n=1 Tax=Photobacterium lutimaris TaxID=388278 RepID=A0A2T3IZH0_9GAMM|nr:hypothetical protein [Photobacterium lutimaris]PSU34051.1 hypothetical protein C9I99_11895 [Photobacterium lutimaris]TDR76396.1 hypothetical protein DFP78_103393 [Photobacterium lutimaris]
MLTVNEKHELKAYLTQLWGAEAQLWPMNEQLFDVTYLMLQDSKKCSDLMELVPRPMPVGANPSSWLTKEVRKAIIRKLKDDKQYYFICVQARKLQWKTRFLEAANGS